MSVRSAVKMNQDISIERIASELTGSGSFSEGSVRLSMDDYYSDSQETDLNWMYNLSVSKNLRRLDPNWVYYAAREIQEQTGGRAVHPGEFYEAISDSSIKEKTNPPLMFQENYFRILDLNQKSRSVMRVPKRLLYLRMHLPCITAYLANEMGYDLLVQYDKIGVAKAVSGLDSGKAYSLDPDGTKDMEKESNREFLPLIDFESLKNTVETIDISEEEVDRVKGFMDGVYSISDEYVDVGRSVMKDSSEFSEESLSGLSFLLKRLDNSESASRIQKLPQEYQSAHLKS